MDFGDIGDPGGSGPITGFGLGSSSSVLRAWTVSIANAASIIYSKISAHLAVNNAWNLLAVSVDILNGNVLFQINSATETYTGQSYSGSPVAGAANSVLQIGALGGGYLPDATGMRYGNVAMWSRALSGAELLSLYTAQKARFGF